MLQAIQQQATREDHPFDPALYEGYRLAEKGLDELERSQMRRARVRLLLTPDLEPAERERLEQERRGLEEQALAALSPEDRQRLEDAVAAASADRPFSDLERSLRAHVESAELRLDAGARDKLLRARRSGSGNEERSKLEAEKRTLEEKAWKTLTEEERAAVEFFDENLPLTPEEREQLAREREVQDRKALATLSEADRTRLMALEVQRRAEASLSAEDRAKVRQSTMRFSKADQEYAFLRARAEQSLNLEERTVLLRARLLTRRDEAEQALSGAERRSLEQLRIRLRAVREREELERSAEERLGEEARQRLEQLRRALDLRRDEKVLRERAEQSLSEADQERLRQLRAQLRLPPDERARLDQRYRQLAFGNLSSEPNSFASGVSERQALTRANAYLEEVLRVAPFNGMLETYALEEDEAGAERLFQLLLRETRERRFARQGERRDAIVRQGDYGGTAFLVIEGRVRIMIQSDDEARELARALGSSETRKRGLLGLLGRWLSASAGNEVRKGSPGQAVRPGEAAPIVIPDFGRLPAQSKHHTLGEGEVFGEIAALTRTPRTATVVPDSDAVRLLEIRWQGLRDLVAEDEAFQKYVEERYRESSRRAYLFRSSLFAGVGDTDAIKDCIRKGDVQRLFRTELGWETPRSRDPFPPQFAVPAAPPGPLRCQLRVRRGGADEVIPLPADATLFRIGSGADNELRLERRPTVSDEHAELRLQRGRWYLRNRSRYGVQLAGNRLRNQAVLFPGAILEVGDDCKIRFEVARPEPLEGPQAQLTLVAESALIGGVGGIKLYRCDLGQGPLPAEQACAAVAEQVARREYLCGETSRHVIVFSGADPKAQDWRWLLPPGDAQEPQEQERGALRYRGDPAPLVAALIHFLALEEVVKVTECLSYGKFRWFERTPEEELTGTHWATRMQGQPVIASQGHYPNGVIMIRAGFGRLTEQTDQGEQTVSYLRPGLPFGYGLEQVIENYLARQDELQAGARGGGGKRVMLPYTLKAIGYADTVFFPTSVLERFVLPTFRPEDLRELVQGKRRSRAPEGLRGLETVPTEVPADLREFLVEHHLVNGRQAMVINLDRCTRCDDCVRGCASAHERDPRFIRHGPIHGNLMVANACMHCVDPVCLIECPTGAIHRPLGGGLVVIHDQSCIGCGACAYNCPYDNIRMVQIRDRTEAIIPAGPDDPTPQVRATKCDLCYDQATRETACVRACPHDALKRVDLSDLASLAELTRWLR